MTRVHESNPIFMPQIYLSDEFNSSLPLEHTAVTAQVSGPLVVVTVTQRFGNPLREPADLDYLFPLPDEAAVMGFDLRTGARRVRGELHEIEKARDTFNQAQQQGRRAGLLEQRRPNLFSLRLANVRPGEVIYATVRYHQRLQLVDGDTYEFVFPMGITPRYDSPGAPAEGQGVHAPRAAAGDPVGPVEITVAVDAGVPLAGEPVSPSHLLEVEMLDERRFQAQLGGQYLPDHDFVLRYRVAGERVQAAGWTSARAGQTIFYAALVPPRWEENLQPPAREFVFVLDRSGSMTGEPIAQARNALRACLRTLSEQDTFRLLLFDDRLEWFRPESLHLTQANLEQADAFLSGVQGRGGTEIVRAIEAALALPPDSERLRFIVFLTDGAVSAEARALEHIRSRLGEARLFTFGIGPSVNRALLSRMARLGRGRVEFLQLNEDIEGAVIRFQDSVSLPVLADLVMSWENGKAWDVYPSRLPDLYAGQVLEICGCLSLTGGEGPVRLKVTGKLNGQAAVISLSLPQSGGQDLLVERVWARSRIEDLLEQLALDATQAARIRAEVLGLALEYQVVTEWTAFVAVDEEPGEQGVTARVIHVAQPLPAGLSFGALQAPNPIVLAAMVPPMPSAAMRKQVRFGPGETSSPPLARSAGRSDPKTAGINDAGERLYAMEPPEMEKISFEEKAAAKPGAEDRLRGLARLQQADGSWGNDPEQTAAALLVFIRAGHTTRRGAFRPALRKALVWLKRASLSGWTACLRARVLAEMAQVSGDDSDVRAAREARLALPAPANVLEAAALDGAGTAPASIASLDDLRLAALVHAHLPVPQTLLANPLASVWAAAMH